MARGREMPEEQDVGPQRDATPWQQLQVTLPEWPERQAAGDPGGWPLAWASRKGRIWSGGRRDERDVRVGGILKPSEVGPPPLLM